ncbi:hypothetical protein CDAR_562621 [Caerostris darwini]|uniref:Uncharacterized protein n=1 Tax=Caerostris darwini TaxID=1538125 RepID=A0AAV4X7M5_9ARAC|nr:hypothetical protein CDAR_562621 [Caerostris darwini]
MGFCCPLHKSSKMQNAIQKRRDVPEKRSVSTVKSRSSIHVSSGQLRSKKIAFKIPKKEDTEINLHKCSEHAKPAMTKKKITQPADIED